ncbi:hypothetical protein [Lysinibacillus fusiformis]|uniref:hypothetical protein n=1 Tax=Lysinibacillus fusiformis TaxID=28031 RepID=UPI003D030DE0
MSDLSLLREVIRWAHANGWKHQVDQVIPGPWPHVWYSADSFASGGVEVVFNADPYGEGWPELSVWPQWQGDEPRYATSPESVRQAVDILVAVGVLPASFSSVHAEVRRLRAEKNWLLKNATPAQRAEFRLCAQTSEVARAEEPNYAELLKELHGHMFTAVGVVYSHPDCPACWATVPPMPQAPELEAGETEGPEVLS